VARPRNTKKYIDLERIGLFTPLMLGQFTNRGVGYGVVVTQGVFIAGSWVSSGCRGVHTRRGAKKSELGMSGRLGMGEGCHA